MSGVDIAGLVEQVQVAAEITGDELLQAAADALLAQAAEPAEANGKLAVRMDYLVGLATTADKHAIAVAETATRQRDEALAALKASEEREAKLIRKLASARLRPEPWQDIASAPKDGSDMLLYGHGVLRSGGVYAKGHHVGWSQVARDDSIYWATRDPAVDCEPTHWRPLPEPPSAMLAAAGGTE